MTIAAASPLSDDAAGPRKRRPPDALAVAAYATHQVQEMRMESALISAELVQRRRKPPRAASGADGVLVRRRGRVPRFCPETVLLQGRAVASMAHNGAH